LSGPLSDIARHSQEGKIVVKGMWGDALFAARWTSVTGDCHVLVE
jgi:hypothetical protein